MMKEWRGSAYCFGDNVNTDYIISSRRKRDTLDAHELKKYIMEDIRPGFYHELDGESILVAGRNFGCGSAMEIAVLVIKASGINVVVAKSFSRSFYRNAINNGVLPIEVDTDLISEGDLLSVQMSEDVKITNLSSGWETVVPGLKGLVREVLLAGGLVAYTRRLDGESVGSRTCL